MIKICFTIIKITLKYSNCLATAHSNELKPEWITINWSICLLVLVEVVKGCINYLNTNKKKSLRYFMSV